MGLFGWLRDDDEDKWICREFDLPFSEEDEGE